MVLYTVMNRLNHFQVEDGDSNFCHNIVSHLPAHFSAGWALAIQKHT